MNHPDKTELKNCFNLFDTVHFDISKTKHKPTLPSQNVVHDGYKEQLHISSVNCKFHPQYSPSIRKYFSH